ncbi:MAG: hypothetical protein RLZZ326_4359, partial [Planctomycetota bacterium]
MVVVETVLAEGVLVVARRFGEHQPQAEGFDARRTDGASSLEHFENQAP